MATNDEIVARLDRIAALLQLAHRDSIEAAREEIRSDGINAAILDATTKLIAAGQLTTAVNRKTGGSPATIGRRIAALVDQGALEKRGAGPSTQYQSTGLI